MNSIKCVIATSHYSLWLQLMSKQKFRGIYRKMQKSWWEVDMSYSLCLEGNSTADRSEVIIMGWERFQPLPSQNFSLLSKSLWENWSRFVLPFADIWNSNICWKGGGICLSEARRGEPFPCARATTFMTWRRYWCLSRTAESWERCFYYRMGLHSFHLWSQKKKIKLIFMPKYY